MDRKNMYGPASMIKGANILAEETNALVIGFFVDKATIIKSAATKNGYKMASGRVR
jgi:hypothetical protein